MSDTDILHHRASSSRGIRSELKTDRILGSVMALALGDAFGAPHEGGLLERATWSMVGKRNGTRRWTDDTQMTLDVIDSLVTCGKVDQDDLAHRFAEAYRWSRGYGPGAAAVLKRIREGQSWKQASRSVYPDGSFGNGGAMRAPAVGLFLATAGEEEIVRAARDSAAVTHAHPLGQEGAVLIALTTALVYDDASSPEIMERLVRRAASPPFLDRLHAARTWLQSGSFIPPETVAVELGNGIAACESCVTAIYVALRLRAGSFLGLLDYAIRLGGDVDTIAAMAGAIWGAARGIAELPESLLDQVEQADRLRAAAFSLARAAGHRLPR
jgi:ADP-ribosylglycohydrolase